MAKLPRITSIAKSIPAIGALKEAPIPAPAPAATRLRIWSSPKCVYLASDEPMVAPIWTTGPSRPAEPPVPSVAAVAAILAPIVRVGRYPPCSETPTIVSVTPPLSTPGPQRRFTRYDTIRPTGSTSSAAQRPKLARLASPSRTGSMRSRTRSINVTRRAAPRPTATPTTSEATRNAAAPRLRNAVRIRAVHETAIKGKLPASSASVETP